MFRPISRSSADEFAIAIAAWWPDQAALVLSDGASYWAKNYAWILTGTDPAFCAGVDLKEAGSDGGVFAHAHELPARGLFDDTEKPVIGAINGATATGGLELALTCDFLIASEHARFADTHSRVGVQPGGGVTVRLARWIGVPRAKQMSVTGNYLDAPTALAWGLVNHVVPHEQLRVWRHDERRPVPERLGFVERLRGLAERVPPRARRRGWRARAPRIAPSRVMRWATGRALAPGRQPFVRVQAQWPGREWGRTGREPQRIDR
jgi:enoyl-CoA hydratase/carnithine racemase